MSWVLLERKRKGKKTPVKFSSVLKSRLFTLVLVRVVRLAQKTSRVERNWLKIWTEWVFSQLGWVFGVLIFGLDLLKTCSFFFYKFVCNFFVLIINLQSFFYVNYNLFYILGSIKEAKRLIFFFELEIYFANFCLWSFCIDPIFSYLLFFVQSK